VQNAVLTHAESCYTFLQAYFAGVALCRLLDYIADALMNLIARFSRRRNSHCTTSSDDLVAVHIAAAEQQLCSMHDAAQDSSSKDVSHACPASPKHVNIRDLEEGSCKGEFIASGAISDAPAEPSSNGEPVVALIGDPPPEDDLDRAVAAAVEQLGDDSCGHLIRTSILVWLALSLHNLPEGLATIVG
jgi:zinc transporter ZupT